jgi:ribose transport system substrate-binding protein
MLAEIAQRTGISHTSVYRIVYTLVQRQLLVKSGKYYHLAHCHHRLRLGYCLLSSRLSFARTVTTSLEAACRRTSVDLISFDNDLQPDLAVRNAQELVNRGVEVAIEFQRHESASALIAGIFARAGISTIAILVPQPGAVYFGVDNFQAGLTAGEALAMHAIRHWRSKPDLVILLDLPQGGPTLQARMSGVQEGIERRLGQIPRTQVERMIGGGDREHAARTVAHILEKRPRSRRILVSAFSDEGAFGARDAIIRAGRAENAAIVGHGGTVDDAEAASDTESPFIGSVAFHPERFGPALVDLASQMSRGETLPAAVHVPHEFVRNGRR